MSESPLFVSKLFHLPVLSEVHHYIVPLWKHNLSGSTLATTLPSSVNIEELEVEVNIHLVLTQHLPLDLLVHKPMEVTVIHLWLYLCSCSCSSTGIKTISLLTSL